MNPNFALLYPWKAAILGDSWRWWFSLEPLPSLSDHNSCLFMGFYFPVLYASFFGSVFVLISVKLHMFYSCQSYGAK